MATPICRECRRWLTDDDAEICEHPRLQGAVRVLYLRADREAVGIAIDTGKGAPDDP